MICALISVYYPAETVKQNVESIVSQVDIVYICDNSMDSNYPMFAGIDSENKIRYICFRENLGLSRAFNQILKSPEISWQDDDYVFFFDQDSHISEGHIQRMVSVYQEARQKGFDVGCLGPVYYNTSNGTVEIPKAKRPVLEDTYAVTSIITSSMLCSYGDLRLVGFWNEEIFLDMADWDLCWRMKAAGMLCCMTEAVVLHHSVGSGEKKIGPVRLRVGQPFREYYQIRDGMCLLFKRYAPIKFRIRYIAMLFIRTPLHLFFLDHRKDRLSYVIKGFADHFRGKRGALQSENGTEKQEITQ